MKPKIFICGHGRHGKDTMAEYLRDNYDFNFVSSSMFCSNFLIFPLLKDKYGYKTVEECFEDRLNHRAEWYDIISDFCSKDKGALTKEIFKKYDIYVGIRNPEEFLESKQYGDISVWVDRSKHLPLEDVSSMGITVDMCDVIIDNNGTLEEFYNKIDEFLLYGKNSFKDLSN
jgi:hypothetical protein